MWVYVGVYVWMYAYSLMSKRLHVERRLYATIVIYHSYPLNTQQPVRGTLLYVGEYVQCTR